MSEDEAKKVAGHEEEQDEVEAHRRHAAATEPADEARKEDDDDFEAHRRHAT